MEKGKTTKEKQEEKKQASSSSMFIMLKEGDICPNCGLGRIKRGPTGDLVCEICGYGTIPRTC